MIEVDERWLSRVLWEARENLDMWADVIELRTEKDAPHVRSLIGEIDTFRNERGWSEGGYGGEGLDPGDRG